MRRLIALLFVLSILPAFSPAKDMSIGTVDLQALFKAYPETDKAEARLEALAEAKKKDLMDSAQEIQDLRKELEGSSSLLAAKTRARKEQDLKDKTAKINLLQQQIQEELKQKEADMTSQILKEIKAMAAQLAKEKGIDLVLDSEKAVYVNGGIDLTPELLKKFEKMRAEAKDDPSSKKK